MKKLLVLYICCSFVTRSYGQTILSDTIYDKSKNIEAIRSEIGEKFSSQIRYFKKSFNSLDRGQSIVDTIFNNDVARKKPWTHYDGSVRIFLHANSNVYIQKTTKYGSNLDSVFQKIKGVYSFMFKELDNLEVKLDYANDTCIRFLSIQTIDANVFGGNNHKELFFLNSFYENGTKFDTGELNHIYKCGNLGTLELIFSKANLLKKLIFYKSRDNKKATAYEFYPNFYCEKYGDYINNLKIDTWFEYHQNGNLKSVGKYKIIINTNGTISSKSGDWKYFGSDGKELQTEFWLNGKIVKR